MYFFLQVDFAYLWFFWVDGIGPGIWNGEAVGGDKEITQIPCSKPGKGFVDFCEVFWPEWQGLQTSTQQEEAGELNEKFSTTRVMWLVQAILVYVHSRVLSQRNKQKYRT